MAKKKAEEESYVLSPLGCLWLTLKTYADRDGLLNVNKIKGSYGEHIVEDFMMHMKKAGHVKREKSEEKHGND